LALSAAHAAAGGQHYPEGCLYVVATPIGNLADISLRALEVLQRVDAVACEDTRHTAGMLTQYGLHKPLLPLHQHNEAQASQTVLARLQAGERVAYVSDAGTPAVNDPGARLVRTVREAGCRVVPLPGASSVTTLLSAAGIEPAHAELADAGFTFVGFLPTKTKERERAVQTLATETRAMVILEAPHRIQDMALALSVLGSRQVSVGRELTKQFEEIQHRHVRGIAYMVGRQSTAQQRRVCTGAAPPDGRYTQTRATYRPAPCAPCTCCWPNCP
jgi:16S rRNA (cytidine1402-2'-O)-methyltransferase